MESERAVALQGEVARLERRVAELEQAAEAYKLEAEERDRRAIRLQEQTRLQRDNFIESIPGVVWETTLIDAQGAFSTTFVSKHLETLLGYTPEECMARPDFWEAITPPDDWQRLLKENVEGMSKPSIVVQCRWITKDGRTIWVESHHRVTRDEAGAIVVVRGVSMDITARKKEEQEQARLREEIIQMQAGRLAELSTPLIPISAKVMVMPLIGTIDSERAQRVLQALLEGMVQSRADTAIVDITGVTVVDTGTAEALIQAAKAVQLLGAQVVLTGIRPDVAQILVSLGVDLKGIVTMGTLESGITYAMARR